jgi:penicillin-binding protein 2
MKAVRDDRRQVNSRLDILRIAAAIGLGALAFSYWYIQFLRGDYYLGLSENNRYRSLPIHAVRGIVLDRQGRVLTENDPAFNLLLYRREVRDMEATRKFLVEVLGLDPEQIEERLGRAREAREFVPVRLAEDVAPEIVARTEAHSPEFPELAVEISEKRRYRTEPKSAHILGYLGEATPLLIRRDPERYHPGDAIGLAGIEAVYDNLLAGTPGERTVVVDSRGREVIQASMKEALAGRSLPLNIDLRLQTIIEEFFRDKVGAAVAMDPQTGGVLALVSSPDFDPNSFIGRISTADWKTLITDDRHPLQNRAIQNTYSPGSVFKIVMAWAALERGIVNPADQVWCPGSATFYGNTYRCHKAGGHGFVDLERALEVSCDVYFYTVGRRLGIDAIAEAATAFGLGAPTGIDLSPEKKGLVPSEAWSRTARGHNWYAGETISVAIGQGPILVTPVQLVQMIAAVGNGGRLVTPKIATASGPSPSRTIPFRPENLATIRQGLWRAVNGGGGTAHAAAVPGLDVCGKTGTVQVIQQKVAIKSENLAYRYRDHAWFVAFAPRDDPKLAVAIFVEHGGHGGSVAAPLAARLFRAYILGENPAPLLPEGTERPLPDPADPDLEIEGPGGPQTPAAAATVAAAAPERRSGR